jgi:hypothetical protein
MPAKKREEVKTEQTLSKNKPSSKKKTKRGKTISHLPPKKNLSKKTKRNQKIDKKFTWRNPKNYPFYISLIGYYLFIVEVIFYWFLSEKNIFSFLGLLFRNVIREPYVPTIIGVLFLLPINTYLTGTQSNFRKASLVGYFFLLRDIAHLLFIFLSYP